MDSNGKNVKRLTNGGGDASPGWSPDGQTIVYSGYEHEEWVEDEEVHFKIFLISPDGTNLRKLAGDIPSTDLDPAWSPDSQRIVFASYREDKAAEIYVMDADGTNHQRLTHDDVTDKEPAWSPDGSKLVFKVEMDEDSIIAVMDADGNNRKNLTKEVLDGVWEANIGPTWSPDGRTIAFTHAVPGRDNAAIHLMTADGVHLKRLGMEGDYSPDWFGPAGLAVSPASKQHTIWGKLKKLESNAR